jgi:hypothetical protein
MGAAEWQHQLAPWSLQMAKPTRFDGMVVKTAITEEGYIDTFDKNGRACLDGTISCRVVLINDLRKYGKGLHIGQLGWTVEGTTDGYKWIEVAFDTGQRLMVLSFGIQRIVPEKAGLISEDLIAKNRNTSYDADIVVAEKCHHDWKLNHYGKYIVLGEMTLQGEGDQELYAFTFPSLQELAELKGSAQYPVKIGYTKETEAGALGRIRGMILDEAGYPEKPVLLIVHRTWDGHGLETQVHRKLRNLDRKLANSLGKEWFFTSKSELLEILRMSPPFPYRQDRPEPRNPFVQQRQHMSPPTT